MSNDKSMRDKVLGEMKRFEAEFCQKNPDLHPDQWRCAFYNNFALNILNRATYKMLEKAGMLDSSDLNNKGASKRKQKITPRQFFEDIDATIQELGMDKNELTELHDRCYRQGNWKEWCDVVFDLYVRLREKGYNHYPDLIG